MRILIVEDDPIQFEFIEETLIEHSKDRAFKIDRIATESEFYQKFEDTAANNPDIIVMDVMLKWADPSPSMPLPPVEIQEEGFYRAGIRCAKKLASDLRTQKIPLIIYSVLDEDDLSEDTRSLTNALFLMKDFESKKILGAIKTLTKR